MDYKHTNYDIENQYPKLVRDKIPRIIKENEGVEPKTRILNDKEFLKYLLKKIVEESVELRNSLTHNNLEEELADIFEIIDAILKLRRKTRQDIVVFQKEKREKRGSFDKRILLISKNK